MSFRSLKTFETRQKHGAKLWSKSDGAKLRSVFGFCTA
jgi:hypothetical protein